MPLNNTTSEEVDFSTPPIKEVHPDLSKAYFTIVNEALIYLDMGFLGKLVYKVTGGLVKTKKQLNIILIGICILFVIISISVLTLGRDPKPKEFSSEPPPGYGFPAKGSNVK